MYSKKQFYDFLNKNVLAVISTVNSDYEPEAAVIGFGQTSKLEIVFGTDNSSRKYKNLRTNSKVAFVIGWDNAETVQYEGIARELKSSELDIVKNNYWTKNPGTKKYHEKPTERYFIVTPLWIRYTNLKSEPWETSEIKF